MSKVVIVDDEPFILMMIEDKFRRAHLEVVPVRESRNAVDVIRKEKPDLVILDWMMPEVSGIDICRILKKDPELSGIPIFMLTAKGQDSDEQIGLQSGVSRYITKPFSPKSLLEMVLQEIGPQ